MGNSMPNQHSSQPDHQFARNLQSIPILSALSEIVSKKQWSKMYKIQEFWAKVVIL
jgi:hypothetical protein